jgi:hopanoid biosynthesis associated protein HpnK
VGPGERGLKRLIVTGDDFGLSLPVNKAIETAFADGILTTTCLMMGAPEAGDAVARAKKHSDLAVGLHVVVVRGESVLPHREIPHLTDKNGRFDANLVRAGIRYFFSPKVRRQLAAEIRAQFDAFRQTGLTLDHVNAHNHMHLHPTVLRLIIDIGRDYGLRAIRVPFEPPGSLFLKPWIEQMKSRLQAAGINFNDYVFGLHHTGQMDRDHVMPLLKTLPDGVSEMFFHPATERWAGLDPAATEFRFEDEYKALINIDVRNTIKSSDIQLIAFRDI